MSLRRLDPDQPLLPSVFDRLIDENPEAAVDPPRSRGQHLAELRASVRRDLENLINTRYRVRGYPRDLEALEVSLVNYGVPDMTSASLATAQQREAFCREIERVIRRFEPRFQHVSVASLTNADQTDRTLRLRIEALIYADPAPEPMVFDSVLDPNLRGFQVAAVDG
ncbi:MAG: type VI secretion system baseplate subunit TssE [Thalassobaculales bacterium]